MPHRCSPSFTHWHVIDLCIFHICSANHSVCYGYMYCMVLVFDNELQALVEAVATEGGEMA